MTERERLVHRFLDQELSAEERLQFVVRLGRDDALRRRVVDLDRLLLTAGRLPRPVVSDGFVDGVLERIAPQPAAWRGLWTALTAPRVLRWNLAGAAAACAALLVVGVLIGNRLTSPPVQTPQATDAGRPDTATSVLVRLVVVQPGANAVQVAGDFNGWDPTRTPLEQAPGGAWTVTLPLTPGRYEYMFVVDGRHWVADPFAAEENDDGFGMRNAVLDVRSPIEAQL
jgi:hypothetical protein